MKINRKHFLQTVMAAAGGAAAYLQSACGRVKPREGAAVEPSASEKLAAKVMGDTISAATVGAVFIGDALGLFKKMAGRGPVDAQQLAAFTGVNERYLMEWLRSMATAGYVDYHPGEQRFELTKAQAGVLADEDSPTFAAGMLQGVVPDLWMIPKVLAVMKTGKGIPYGEYPPETFQSIDRGTRPDYLHALTQEWFPAIPGLVDRLKAGIAAADLGSGGGLASIQLAKAFPRVRAFGYEPYEPSVKRATESARAAGIQERVQFSTFDGVHVPGGPYGLITMNYALHHAGDPAGILRSARGALDKDGVMLVVEYKRSDNLEQDINTLRQVAYSFGLLECLPTALAENGPGYGAGIQASEMRRLAKAAGFGECTSVLPEDPMRQFFVLRG